MTDAELDKYMGTTGFPLFLAIAGTGFLILFIAFLVWAISPKGSIWKAMVTIGWVFEAVSLLFLLSTFVVRAWLAVGA